MEVPDKEHDGRRRKVGDRTMNKFSIENVILYL